MPLPGDAREGAETVSEQAELARLRAEVARLRARPPARARRIGWRSPVAALLIVLGCVLAPLSVIAVWTASQVSDTSRYVANVAPLIGEPSIQHALTDRVSNQITTRLDVQKLTSQAADALTRQGLPRAGSLLHAFSVPVASAVDGFVHGQVAKLVASPQVARLWTQVNRTAHAQLVKALSGQGPSAVTVSNNQVVIDLAPFIDQAKKDLAARGLTIVTRLPEIHPTYPLFSATYLVKAQVAYRLLKTLQIVLPILTVILLGLGVYAARNRRRALIGAGLGFAASMVVLGALLQIFRSAYLGSLPAGTSAPAAADLFDTLVRFVRDGLRVLLAVGLIVSLAAFFTGPSAPAVTTRQWLAAGLGWLRAGGERAGLRTGPVGRWTYAHRRGLRITALAVAALVFVFWSQPTWLVAVVIVIVLLAVLALVELVGRPPPVPAAGPR